MQQNFYLNKLKKCLLFKEQNVTLISKVKNITTKKLLK